MIEVAHSAHSRAPREVVWALLSDLTSWHTWGPWTETTLEGDIRTLVSERRRMSRRPYVMTERVTALAAPDRFEYDLLSGLPVKDYHATVTLSERADGGTDIEWRSTFRAPYPLVGPIWRNAMQKVIRDVSEALADAADVAMPAR